MCIRDSLYRLKDWVLEHGCHVVAMESTGVYWRPVHNVLELSLIHISEPTRPY